MLCARSLASLTQFPNPNTPYTVACRTQLRHPTHACDLDAQEPGHFRGTGVHVRS